MDTAVLISPLHKAGETMIPRSFISGLGWLFALSLPTPAWALSCVYSGWMTHID